MVQLVGELYTNLAGCATDGALMELSGEQFAQPELRCDQLEVILVLLAQQTGLPLFDAYKESCVKRRIAARIRRSGCLDVEQYLCYLQQDAGERQRLLNSLSIHVSQFFRNPTLFETLQAVVLPALVQRTAERPLRIWSVGCSAGEEPYSLAILLVESFGEQAAGEQFEILATDIDRRTLVQAEQALYDAEPALRAVSVARRERFFTEQDGCFKLCPAVQQLVRFRQMDLQLVADYPRADLVVCRNTLIYFNRPTQEKILQTFADILPQDGILVLGKSESMPAPLRARFATLDATERIYSRR
jgi:chemotaxis protein methyltransferase CheR